MAGLARPAHRPHECVGLVPLEARDALVAAALRGVTDRSQLDVNS